MISILWEALLSIHTFATTIPGFHAPTFLGRQSRFASKYCESAWEIPERRCSGARSHQGEVMAFTDDAVLAKLSALNETQESIVTVAQWVLFHK